MENEFREELIKFLEENSFEGIPDTEEALRELNSLGIE